MALTNGLAPAKRSTTMPCAKALNDAVCFTFVVFVERFQAGVSPNPVVTDVERGVQIGEVLKAPGIELEVPQQRSSDPTDAEGDVAHVGLQDKFGRHGEAVMAGMGRAARGGELSERRATEAGLDGTPGDRERVVAVGAGVAN